MPAPTILAIDPGLTTGMAFNIRGNYETLAQPDRSQIYDLLLDPEVAFDVVIVEKFTTSRIHSHIYGIITVELIGGIEALCYYRNFPLERRTNIQRLPFMTAAKKILKDSGRKFVDHEVDALAHLLGWERYHSRGNA